MEQAPEQHHADYAHIARLSFIEFLRNNGCTCHPYLAVAVVENMSDQLVPVVKELGHEPRCALNLVGRDN